MLYHLINSLLGIVFLQSSIGKIQNPYIFEKAVMSYKLIPFKKKLSRPLLLLGSVELLFGLIILFRIENFYEATIILAMLLQLLFITILFMNFNNLLPYGCGCFGLQAPQIVNSKHLIVNFLIMLGLLYLLFNV